MAVAMTLCRDHPGRPAADALTGSPLVELRKDSLSFIETLGQSVANVSPTLTPALAVAVVAGMAGTASWLVYVVATIALLVVGHNVGKLARRIPSAGSFFIYVSRSLGPVTGLLAGWAMLAAYLFTAMALTVATSIFVKTLFASLHAGFVPSGLVTYLVVSILAVWLAVRDIRLSSRISLSLEAVSVVIILFVTIAALAHAGFAIDTKQISLAGMDIGKSVQAIVFAIFSYVGFESAATLGKEARDPGRTIPQAIMLTALTAGVFFVFTTYVITQGFADDADKLGNSGAPLADILTGQSPLLTALVYFGATISSFACALASINSFARIMFSLGRYQFLHGAVGRVHATHQTPHIALLVGAVLNFVLVAAFSGFAELDTFGWYGTIASFGFIFVYLLCSIAAPAYLRRTREMTGGDVAMGVLGAVLMVLALFGSVYPVPAYPYNLLPYGFVAYMLVGAAWFGALKLRAPASLARIEHDMEVAASRAVPAELV
jgi:amino acid transporter